MGLSKSPVPQPDRNDEVVRVGMNLTPPDDAHCMYCLEPVAHPCIYWSVGWALKFGDEDAGAIDATVYLHKDCAVYFAAALLRDVKEMGQWERVARRAKRD